MDNTTIILTVSRDDFLGKVITSIELLECQNDTTNILCIVDGPPTLFLKTRNLINETKFNKRLTVQFKGKNSKAKVDIKSRRARISAIHNEAKKYLTHDKGYVFSIEDDTTFGPKALKKLLRVAQSNKALGMAEGVELGRWGVPYVGAWIADDIYNPQVLTSVENIHNTVDGRVSNIDAGGLYCSLIRTDLYKQHDFTSKNGLGPDINFGLECRQLGFDNFIVWNIRCTHHFIDKKQKTSISATEQSQKITMKKLNEKRWLVYY